MLAGLYARAGAHRGERVVYYGFEEPRPILLRNFAQIGMPLDELERSGALSLVCRYPEAMGFEDLLVKLREGLEDFQPSLMVIDSLSSIEHSMSEKGFRQFMVGLASLIREHSRSALLTQTVMAGGAAEHTAPYLSTIADGIIALDYTFDETGQRRVMRVIKMRGSEHDTHPYRLWIGRGGLMVRVDPEQTDHLVSSTNAHPMEMKGRPVDGWLRVDAEHVRTKRQLTTWVRRGTAYASSLPAKKGKRPPRRT